MWMLTLSHMLFSRCNLFFQRCETLTGMTPDKMRCMMLRSLSRQSERFAYLF
jgi:hypothetical protein